MQTNAAIPATLQAGDTIAWVSDVPEYLASDGWVLSWRLINAAERIDIVSIADGARHRVALPATATAGYAPGAYTVVAFVSRGVDRITLGQGETRVLPDLAAAAVGQDARSPAQRALDDLRAALARWLSSRGHVQEYQIAGRLMRFANAAEIQRRITLAEAEVAREKNQLAGRAPSRRLLVRF